MNPFNQNILTTIQELKYAIIQQQKIVFARPLKNNLCSYHD